MQKRRLHWLLFSAWMGAGIASAAAQTPADIQRMLQQGDLRGLQLNLQNTVRSDPQNAAAHFWLGKVDLDLGDPVTAEAEARAARKRGFDPQQAVSLQAQAMLAQNKFKELLQELQPDGQDTVLDGEILVARGFAQLGLQDVAAAEASFTLAEQTTPDAVEPWLAHARLLATRGDLAGAQEKIDRALVAQPKSPEALVAKAEILRARNDLPGALAIFDQIIADTPGNMKLRLERADLLIASNQPDKAAEDVDTILNALPGNVEALYLHAVLQVRANDYAGADATLAKIAAFIPRIPRGYLLGAIIKEHLGQIDVAAEMARRYVANQPNELNALKILGRLEMSRQRPDLVIEELGKAIEPDHGDAEAFDMLGRAYAATGRDDDAVSAYMKAVSLSPDDVGLQMRLAAVRMHAGQPELAMAQLEHTFELAPQVPEVADAWFFAALATGDIQKASTTVDAVSKAQGDTPTVGNIRGLLLLAQLDIEAAAAQFRSVLKDQPDYIPAKLNLARVLAMLGDTAGAEQQLSDILQRNPVSEPALTMLVSQLTKADQAAQALALMEKAHNAQPEDTHLTVSIGEYYLRANRPAEALILANKDPAASTSIAILGLKASAQIALGQKAQARSTLAQMLQLDPTSTAALRQLNSLLVEAGEYDAARAVIRGGLAVSPKTYPLYLDYALIDLKANGIDAAMATAKALQDHDPDFDPARALQGDIYVAADRPDDAVKAFSAALAAKSSNTLLLRLTSTLMHVGNMDGAIKVMQDWSAQHPDDLDGQQQLSDVQIAAHHYADAIAPLEVILKTKRHDPLALNNLAWLYQMQHDPRAEGLARQAYILTSDGQTADTLGWILLSKGDAKTGLALMRQAVSQAGDDPEVKYHYAVALHEAGQRDEAIKLLNAALADKTEFSGKPDAQRLLEQWTRP